MLKLGSAQRKDGALTTRAVHLDILTHLDVETILIVIYRFTAHRGMLAEILSDQFWIVWFARPCP